MDRRFDAIISDIYMPIMNGMDFFSEAVQKERDIGKRFLFFSGAVDQKLDDFFKTNKVDYILKPGPINILKQKVAKIMKR
jgi:two-component SAPR family response regulator